MARTHPSVGALVVNVILVLPSPYHTKRGGEEGRKCREKVDVKEAIATRRVHTSVLLCMHAHHLHDYNNDNPNPNDDN